MEDAFKVRKESPVNPEVLGKSFSKTVCLYAIIREFQTLLEYLTI